MTIGVEPVAPVGRTQGWATGRSRRLWMRAWPNAAVLGIVSLAIVVPIGMLLFNSLNNAGPGDAAHYSLANWREAFANDEMGAAIWNTVRLGVTRTAIGLVAAVFLAWLIARTDMPGAKVIEFMLWLAFFIPSLPLTLGWILLADAHFGVLNDLIRHLPGLADKTTGPFNIYGFWGIIWVHLTGSTVPFMTVLIVPAFRRMSTTLEECARICGASRLRTVLRVTIPTLSPAILAAAMLSFIWSLKGFEVELLLGTPIGLNVFSTQIYNWIRFSPPEFGLATALGSAFIVIMVLMALAYRWVLRGREYTTVGSHTFNDEPISLGPVGRIVAAAGCWLLILVSVVLPVGFVVVGSFMTRYGFFQLDHPFTRDNWSKMLNDPLFVSSTKNTLILGLGAVALGLVVYLALANIVVRSRLGSRGVVDVLTWMPIAVPGILLSLGLLWTFLATPFSTVLYGTLFGLVLAIVIEHMASGTQQTKAALMQISPDLEGAARVSGANRLLSNVFITLPLLGPSLASVAILTFVSAVRDISTVVLLSNYGSTPLSILMLQYSFGGELERGAALGVLLSLLMAAFALVARGLAGTSLRKRGRRLLGRRTPRSSTT
jgi:iron(III) transport system permease protein